jgi:hypothetical protein
MGRRPALHLAAFAAMAAALSACAFSDGGGKAIRESPVHGLISLELIAAEADGSLAVDGLGGSVDESDEGGGAAVLVDLLWPRWMLSFEGGSHLLSDGLDLSGGAVTIPDTISRYRHDELFVGAALLTIDGPAAQQGADAPRPPPRFRLDALAGARLNTVTIDDIEVGGFEVEEEREHWVDVLAGLRAEWRLSEWWSLRSRGDARVAGESDAAWSLRASVVYGPAPGWAIAAGWEARSVDFESGSGPSLGRYDALLSGPFIAFELLF